MQEKLIIGAFFIGAVVCLFFSASYHTFCCYSISVSNIFRKLDYCGISVLTMGSFVPWLHYAFMCDITAKTFYLVLIGILGCTCIAVSLIDKFGEADYRAMRAGTSSMILIGYRFSKFKNNICFRYVCCAWTQCCDSSEPLCFKDRLLQSI